MTFEQALDRLKTRIHPLARFVHGFAGTFDPPVMVMAEGGFRYSKPDFRHFCLLRSCRIVSALSGSIELARCGYPQEIGVLCRVVQESSSQINAVMAQITTDGRVSGKLAEFIDAYFQDVHRSESSAPDSPAKLSQKYVNELIGSRLDQFNSLEPTDPNWKSAAERYWHVDWVFLELCTREISRGDGFVRRNARSISPLRNEGNAKRYGKHPGVGRIHNNRLALLYRIGSRPAAAGGAG